MAAAIAILAVHVLALRFLPTFRASEPPAAEGPAFTVVILPPLAAEEPRAPAPSQRPSARRPPLPSPDTRNAPATALPPVEPAPSTAPRAIDWSKEAARAAADRLAADADTVRRAGTFEQWKQHVMPAPDVPRGPDFRWDEAHIHRLTPTPQGMLVALNDRCAVLFSPLAIIPGCRIGSMPSHGDLFAHMRDPERVGD